MATLELTHSQANRVLREYLEELGDEAYAAFLMKVVRDGKYRRSVNHDALVVKIKRAWHEPKEGRKMSAAESDEF